jgi:hypothetical protein
MLYATPQRTIDSYSEVRLSRPAGRLFSLNGRMAARQPVGWAHFERDLPNMGSRRRLRTITAPDQSSSALFALHASIVGTVGTAPPGNDIRPQPVPITASES